MSTLHWTLAACLLVVMQAHAQGRPDSQPAFHASSSATSTRREVLEAFSPVSYASLKRLEARRGALYADSELDAVLRSESFQREYGIGLSAFCSNSANAPNLACSPPADATDRPRKGVTP
ncbi:MAG: hypothetical protein JF606_00220 [Burkholderiales bacterium]|nr:hypothetical protein [Burkholderiales bacterium]